MAYLRADHSFDMDENEIRKALSVLKQPGKLFEIRVLRKSGSKSYTMSAYFNDIDTAIKKMKSTKVWKNSNVYFTLNEINPACFSREQHNEFIESTKTTDDPDILSYKLMLVDLDPERTKEVSSSEEELVAAGEVAKNVITFTRAIGWPEPIQGMSGNGYHFLYELDSIPNTEETKTIIKKVLETLQQKFGTDGCKVDEVNFNPSRICKLYGTVAHKGSSTQDRPHRMSRIISVPDVRGKVTKHQLEAVAALWTDPNSRGKQANNSKKASGTTPAFTNEQKTEYSDKLQKSCKKYGIRDLGEYLDSIGISHQPSETWRTGRKWVLDSCPFDENHKAPDSAVFQFADGQLRFRCLHNSCKDYHFAQFLNKVDPKRYASASIQQSEKPPLTIENLAAEYDERGISVKLNLITHEIEVETDGADLDYDSLITTTHSILKSNEKNYTGVTWDTLAAYTLELAKQNKFNPVLDFLNSIKFDGHDHFAELYELMGIEKEDSLSRSLIRKWFLQGIALLHNSEAHHIAPEGVLTLNGPQRCGKTSLVEMFAIKPEWFARGAALNPNDKDTIRRCCSRWIIELGEVETTLRSDIEALKNFITNDVDVYRVAYGHSDLKYARRSNLAATCNSDKYLIDQTGNRRWWTIPISKMIRYSEIQTFPIVQLYLQALKIYQDEGCNCFRLTGDEFDALEDRNSKALKPMKAEDEVNDVLATAKETPNLFKWVNITVTDWKDYFSGLKKYDAGTIGKALKKIGIIQRTNGSQRLYSLPIWKEVATHYKVTPRASNEQIL